MSMVRLQQVAMLLFLFLYSWAEEAQACTAVTLQTGAGWLTARNYDWDTEPAWLLVNRRGAVRQGLVQGDPGPAARWTSRYGSLTVNQYGLGFPCSGMNEVGLSVDVLWLTESRFPAPDGRPALRELQWVQYVLDQAATVDEALRLGAQVRIAAGSSPLHFYLADKQGNPAVLEFIDGKPVITRPSSQAPFGITNDAYQPSEAFRQAHLQEPMPASDGSLARYCRALGFASQTRGMALDTSNASTALYAILHSVATQRTVWQLVYEPERGRFWYKSAHARDVKYIDLPSLDFAPASASLGLPLVLPLFGNTYTQLRPYTPADNLSQITLALKELGDKEFATPAAVSALSDFQMGAPALLPERPRKPTKAR